VLCVAAAGTAMLGVGCAAGPNRAEQAALAAVSAPLIQQSVERATGGHTVVHANKPQHMQQGAAVSRIWA
jgi:cell division protein FtsZ